MDAQQYTRSFDDFHVPDKIRIDKAIGLIKKEYSSVRGLRILDVGIAKEGVADRLKNEGAHCFGVDINSREIPGIEIKKGDLNDGIPDFGEKFDVIFAGEIMEHLFDELKFLNACRAALKPHGLLVLTVPNLVFSANRVRMMFGGLPRFAYAAYHYHMYNRAALMGLLREAGFEVRGFRSSHLLFSTNRNPIGKVFEWLGDLFPSAGAHLIVSARPKD